MPVQLGYLGEALVTLVAVEGQRVDSHMTLQKMRIFQLQETEAAPCWSLAALAVCGGVLLSDVLQERLFSVVRE